MGVGTRARHARPGPADGVHALRLSAFGADARRAPGQGSDGRLRHPDARRHHARGGRGRHRLRTQFTLGEFAGRDLRKLRQSIEAAIPLSAGKYNTALTETAAKRVAELEADAAVDYETFAKNWRLQLGSLGSGNHFIEVTADEEQRVWLFLHSGSRGLGNKIAMHHIGVAATLCRQWHIQLPDRDLAYLVADTDEFDAYIRDLQWAQKFALLNREEMMDRLAASVEAWIGEPIVSDERVNCHHNFTQREEHFGKQLWVSRKGAIEA
ncbi:MAG TPA: RtcB family protein, partial [Acidothermaceae bacterium]|nr:RtcB family protein [Acidothermaceae bacterium]